MHGKRIVELYWARDAEAIVQSGRKYGAYCFSVAKNILDNHEDAEECVNDTWLDAWNAMPPHRPNVLRMFFVKITRRICLDRWRRRTAQKRGSGEVPAVLEELADCIADESDVEEELIAKELAECIRAFLRTLPARECDIFLRRYFFTEPIAEISAGYGITNNHTAVILSRTRNKLKTYLAGEGYFNE